MLDPASIATDRTIWAVADAPQGTAGTGSRESPLRLAGNLDAVAAMLGASARLNLLPGVYQTSGLLFPSTFILDAPDGGVTVRLADNATSAPGYPHIKLLWPRYGWASFVSLDGIVFDANWLGQPARLTANFKIELAIRSLQLLVRNCTLLNFGASGGPDNYLEGFFLSGTTVANGDLESYFPEKRYIHGLELSPSRIEFLDNSVEQPFYTGGAYGTDIFWRTNMGVAAGDRQPMGSRTTEAVLIRGNKVVDYFGNCLGCGGISENGGTIGDWGAERCLVENNQLEGRCELNMDTGKLLNFVYRNNRSKVCQGPNITPNVMGENVELSDNLIQLTGPFHNATLGTDEPQWGIHAEQVINGRTNGNILILPQGYAGTTLEGIADIDNTVIRQGVSGDSVALAEAVAQVKTLIAELDEVRKDLLDATVELQKSDSRNIELKQRLASVAEIAGRP